MKKVFMVLAAVAMMAAVSCGNNKKAAEGEACCEECTECTECTECEGCTKAEGEGECCGCCEHAEGECQGDCENCQKAE